MQPDGPVPTQEAADEMGAVVAFAEGDPAQLDGFADRVAGFPPGQDRFMGRHWLTHAIQPGNTDAVAWVLGKGVAVDFRDDEGNSPLKAVIADAGESGADLTLRLMDMLFAAGPNPAREYWDLEAITPLWQARRARRPEIVAIPEDAIAARAPGVTPPAPGPHK